MVETIESSGIYRRFSIPGFLRWCRTSCIYTGTSPGGFPEPFNGRPGSGRKPRQFLRPPNHSGASDFQDSPAKKIQVALVALVALFVLLGLEVFRGRSTRRVQNPEPNPNHRTGAARGCSRLVYLLVVKGGPTGNCCHFRGA